MRPSQGAPDPLGPCSGETTLNSETESERQPMDHLSSTNIARILPTDGFQGALVGRVWRPGIGPSVVAVREDGLFDITSTCSTVSGLAALDDPAGVLKDAK